MQEAVCADPVGFNFQCRRAVCRMGGTILRLAH